MKTLIQTLRELEAAATEGPWRPYPHTGWKWVTTEALYPQWGANHQNDAAFVAEARNSMSALLSRIERLQKALAELVGASEKDELEVMEAMIRLSPAPEADKAAMINAIHVLLED